MSVVVLRAHGHPLRAIAAQPGMSWAGVQRVLRRVAADVAAGVEEASAELSAAGLCDGEQLGKLEKCRMRRYRWLS